MYNTHIESVFNLQTLKMQTMVCQETCFWNGERPLFSFVAYQLDLNLFLALFHWVWGVIFSCFVVQLFTKLIQLFCDILTVHDTCFALFFVVLSIIYQSPGTFGMAVSLWIDKYFWSDYDLVINLMIIITECDKILVFSFWNVLIHKTSIQHRKKEKVILSNRRSLLTYFTNTD